MPPYGNKEDDREYNEGGRFGEESVEGQQRQGTTTTTDFPPSTTIYDQIDSYIEHTSYSFSWYKHMKTRWDNHGFA